MAKYYGKLGFASMVTDDLGVTREEVAEHDYVGDILKVSRRMSGSSAVNSDITISNQISIVADPYIYSNIMNLRYATFMGSKWVISSVEVERPRIVLTLGGVYNGPTGPSA